MSKKPRLSLSADLHINYESVPAYEGVKVTGANSGLFEVEKMRFPVAGHPKCTTST